jgi:hypothetical protein
MWANSIQSFIDLFVNISEPYTGMLATTSRRDELTSELPLEQLVNVYSTGRSDEVQRPPKMPEAEPPTAAVITTTQYPISVLYEGPMSSTQPNAELEVQPLHSHVTAYHHGRSDVEMRPPPPSEAQPEEAKKTGTLERLTHLFKRTAHQDFPISEPYTGPIGEMSSASQMPPEHIQTHVTVYSSGRSDEMAPPPTEQQIVTTDGNSPRSSTIIG